MDAKISGGTPQYFVYDVGQHGDVSGGKKADNFFIGSKIGQVNIQGEMKTAVIFQRVPIKNLSAIDTKTRREAKQAAADGVNHFKTMLKSFGVKADTAEKVTNFSLVPEKRIKQRDALDLKNFEEMAVTKLTIPVVVSAADNDQLVQQPSEIVQERKAKSATRPLPASPAGKLKSTKPLPEPPASAAKNKPAAKPLPPIPQHIKPASAGVQDNPSSGTNPGANAKQ